MFKNLAILLITLQIFSINGSYADQAYTIHKGESAPVDGVLMDQEKSNKVEIQLKEHDLFQQIISSQEKSISLLKQNEDYSNNKVNMLLDQNDKLSESLKSSQSMNNWERVGFFALGVIATIGAGLAIQRATK